MAAEEITIPLLIFAAVASMVVGSIQGWQVPVSHRPPEETSASESGRSNVEIGAC